MMTKRTSVFSALAIAVALSLGGVACDNDNDLEDKVEDAADEIEDKVD
jgi:hypothetical protein